MAMDMNVDMKAFGFDDSDGEDTDEEDGKIRDFFESEASALARPSARAQATMDTADARHSPKG